MADLCIECGRRLNPKRAVMLDLSSALNLYRLGEWEYASQGGFWFGRDCAAAALKKTVQCGYYAGDGVKVHRDKAGNLIRVSLPE